jgi:hypothetical protein
LSENCAKKNELSFSIELHCQNARKSRFNSSNRSQRIKQIYRRLERIITNFHELDGLISISTDYSNSNEFLQFLRIERIIFHSKLPLETSKKLVSVNRFAICM